MLARVIGAIERQRIAWCAVPSPWRVKYSSVSLRFVSVGRRGTLACTIVADGGHEKMTTRAIERAFSELLARPGSELARTEAFTWHITMYSEEGESFADLKAKVEACHAALKVEFDWHGYASRRQLRDYRKRIRVATIVWRPPHRFLVFCLRGSGFADEDLLLLQNQGYTVDSDSKMSCIMVDLKVDPLDPQEVRLLGNLLRMRFDLSDPTTRFILQAAHEA